MSSKEAELRIVLRVRTPSLAAAAAVTYVLLALYFDTFLLLSLSLSLSSVPASLLSMCARACISMSEWILHSHLGIGSRFGEFN